MKDLQKAYEITDAKIQFVSLVDKAANRKQFLITKAENGQAAFTTFGRIVKADEENHYLTGIVYEPLVEDAHGNFMTEAEITKAAYYFTKNGNSIDIQHSFEPLEKATVVENWVAKADFKIDDTEIKKGTWLMTVEVSDSEVWEAVQKGEITGFSMGGVGNYSEEDTNLDNVSKKETANENTDKKGLFKKLAALFGMDVIEKGAMTDEFNNRTKSTLFWNAFYSLEDLLYRYNWHSDKYEFEEDEATIREALEEFSSIVQSILTTEKSITKALVTDKPVKKAGKKLSCKNKETLTGIYDSLGTFLKEFDEEEETDDTKSQKGADDNAGDGEKKEETEVKKSEVEQIVSAAITKALSESAGGTNEPTPTPDTTPVEITQETIEKMVAEAVSKALKPEDEPMTAESIQKMISEQVAKAVEPVLKSRGLPTNLDGDNNIQKSGEQHYLHGIL